MRNSRRISGRMVIKKTVTDKQYDSIKNTIEHFIHNPNNYKFDIPNMILAKKNIGWLLIPSKQTLLQAENKISSRSDRNL